MTDFANILRTLIDGRVEFVLVGGAAAVVHGSARLTQDVDVVYSRADANIASLVQAIAPLHPYLRGAPAGLPFRWDAQTIRQGLNFTLTTDLGELDLLGEITGGGGYENLLPHSVLIQAFGAEFRCLDLDWLIRVKRAAGRPKDLESVAELESLFEKPP